MLETIYKRDLYYEMRYAFEVPKELSEELVIYLAKPYNMVGFDNVIYRTVGMDLFNRYIPAKKPFKIYYTGCMLNILQDLFKDTFELEVDTDKYFKFMDYVSLKTFIVPINNIDKFCANRVLGFESDTKIEVYKTNSVDRVFLLWDNRLFLVNIIKKMPIQIVNYFENERSKEITVMGGSKDDGS